MRPLVFPLTTQFVTFNKLSKHDSTDQSQAELTPMSLLNENSDVDILLMILVTCDNCQVL